MSALSLRLTNPQLRWAILAVVAGIGIALLPLPVALAVAAVTVIAFACVVDYSAALLVLFTAAPLKALIETEVPGALNWGLDIGQMLFLAVTVLWIGQRILRRDRFIFAWSPTLVPIIIVIVSAGFSVWTTLSYQRTIKELVIWVAIAVMCALVTSHARRNASRYALAGMVAALLIGGCVQSLIGLYEFLGGSGAAHLWILDYRFFRAFGSFGQPNPFGGYMGLLLALCVGVSSEIIKDFFIQIRFKYQQDHSLPSEATRRGHIGDKKSMMLKSSSLAILIIAATGILALGLGISWSRGAWVGFAAALVVMLILYPRRRAIGIGLAALLIGGGALAVVTGIAPPSIIQRFSDFTQDLTGFGDVRGQVISDANYAVLERFAHWQAAFWMAEDSPYTGIGFGAYEVAYPKYELMNWTFALGHAHNYYLNMLAETGLIGLIGYVAAWGMILLLSLRALDRSTGWRRGLALGLLGVWTHLLVHSLFDKLYVNNLFLHIGAMLGLIGALLPPYDDKGAASIAQQAQNNREG
ncbi:MAG: O-antigen ligase family protein [Anaerolineae bacterium]